MILVLTWLNLRGIRFGILAQGWLTAAEVIGLLLIVAAAVLLPVTPEISTVATAGGTPSLGAFGLAMVFVLLTYGGWNEAAYISAEIRDGRRNMVLALAVSILIITALYLIVTWACWKGLGMAGMAKSEALAADLMRVAFGATGEKIMALLVAVVAITSINLNPAVTPSFAALEAVLVVR